MKNSDQPHAPGWASALGLARSAIRCGARCRSGLPCRSPAMPNGRCRMHGGASPGAPRGIRNGRYRHGRWTIERQALMVEARELRRVVTASIGLVRSSS